MNVINTPPLPPPVPDQPGRRAVGAVAPARPTGDAAEDVRRSPGAARIEPDEREARGAEAQSLSRVERDLPRRVDRALSAYAAVAGEERRESLRDMLGFDGYA